MFQCASETKSYATALTIRSLLLYVLAAVPGVY